MFMSINWSRWLAPFVLLAGLPYVLKPLWNLGCTPGNNYSGVCILTLPTEIFAQTMTLLALVAVYAVQAHRAGRFGFISFILNFIFTTIVIGVNFFAFFYEKVILGARFDPPPEMLAFFMVAFFGWILSSVLFGLSTLLARTLPRWAAVAFMIGPVLNLAPTPGGMLAAVVLGAGLIGMGIAIWRRIPD
jgi:hypothetical protein